jgi:hypothetical protein
MIFYVYYTFPDLLVKILNILKKSEILPWKIELVGFECIQKL